VRQRAARAALVVELPLRDDALAEHTLVQQSRELLATAGVRRRGCSNVAGLSDGAQHAGRRQSSTTVTR
jgi:hypothetical protein